MTVYNSRIPLITLPRTRFAGFMLGLWALLQASALAVAANNWNDPAQQLAQRISAVTGPGAVSLDLNNRSSLSSSEADQVRRVLITSLETRGVRIVDAPQAAASIHVTLSENQQNYLWVAQVRQGTAEEKVVMVALPDLRPRAAKSSATVTVHRTPLWSQEARILDVALLYKANPGHMLVLEPEQVVLYRWNTGHWQTEQAFPIIHQQPWPRDVRGRLMISQEHLFDAYLPGVVCSAVLSSPLSMACHEADDAWPLANPSFNLRAFFSPARNFFTGALTPPLGQQNTAPFYSAAPLPRENYVLWVMAGVDGAVHFADGMNDRVSPGIAWGSDLVSLKTSCGSGWQVLASRMGDGSDSLRAYEIADREPTALSESAEFGGPITALWTKDDGSTAVAIAHNLETGMYEAFGIYISCGH